MAHETRAQQSADRSHKAEVTHQPAQQAVEAPFAFSDSASLTPASASYLQRTAGNLAVTRLLQRRLGLQPKLQLGPAGDRYEQEANRVAQQVTRQIDASPPVQRELDGEAALTLTSGIQRAPAYSPIARQISRVQRVPLRPPAPLQRQQEEDELAQMMPLHGPEGGDVERGVEHQIQSVRGAGNPLDEGVRGAMEHGFGADFSGVRIHTGGQADTLNRSLNARAFTVGSDIFFRSGEYNPGSAGGQQLLAHELTHTVQQGGSPHAESAPTTNDRISRASSAFIQRDIGFEFETQGVYTKKSNTGALPNVAYPNAGAANAAWLHGSATRVRKGAALLKRADIEVQADDRGNDSDLEVVTTHFPLNGVGRGRLDNAMTDMVTLVGAHQALRAGGVDVVTARALNNTANFRTTMRDGMFAGNWSTAMTQPQVTMGMRVGNIGDIVKDLHGDPHESPLEKATRDPGRLYMRRPDALNPAEPRALAPIDEAQTLINGYGLAQAAVAAQQLADPPAPGGSEIEGFLTIIFTYCEGMQHKNTFLKQHTPFMAKTNLATLFTTLPANVQTYYSQKDPATGRSNLEATVETQYGAARMGQPLFQGVGGVAEDDQALGQPQWYHALTLESWLRGIVLRDRTKGEAFVQWFKDNWAGSDQRPGEDQLTSKAFPGKPRDQQVEGYGALGRRMDRHIGTGDALPVFELRSASRNITYAQAHQWALDFFDYIRSLNNNPGGGYAHM